MLFVLLGKEGVKIEIFDETAVDALLQFRPQALQCNGPIGTACLSLWSWSKTRA